VVPVLALAGWLTWLIAVVLFAVIGGGGVWFLRSIARSTPSRRLDPEDVADLDVFFVCGECGTEFQVTRLGEIQVPRHCGEPMKVVRRPRQQPSND
jgi:hypothetical protein